MRAVLLDFQDLLDSFVKDLLLLQKNLIRIFHLLFLRLLWRTLVKSSAAIEGSISVVSRVAHYSKLGQIIDLHGVTYRID